MEKYDVIGTGYNRTSRADPFLVDRLYLHLKTQSPGRYLDIGCGTGNYTIALNTLGLDFVGVDPSEKMLSIARSKSDRITWINGQAESITDSIGLFDGCIAFLTLHHWQDLSEGFKKLSRVLQPNSRLVIFTSTPEQMENYWIGYYFPEMLRKSILQMPSYDFIRNALTTAGFAITTTEKYFVTNELQDLFLQSGKYNPGLYLKEEVRQGISSFASFSGQEEKEKGLMRLKQDIETKEINSIVSRYDNETGDYMFIVAEKR